MLINIYIAILSFFEKKGILAKPTRRMKKILFRIRAKEVCESTSINFEKICLGIYIGDPKGYNHYEMWDPIFSKFANNKYIVICRCYNVWWRYRENPNVIPIYKIDQMWEFLKFLPNFKAVFFPSNNGSNCQIVRNPNLEYIFLGHGDSNKASSANKVFRLYDKVWVAGKAHIDRFLSSNWDHNSIKLEVIGQPWMSDWLEEYRETKLNLPTITHKKNSDWLYLPTWKGYFKDSDYSSLSEFENIFEKLSLLLNDESSCTVKMHPWSSINRQKQISKIEGNIQVIDKACKIKDSFSNNLSFVVCDNSAALTESLYLNIPIFLYYPSELALINENFDEQTDFCYHFSTVDELSMLVEKVIVNQNDYLAEIREKKFNYVVDIEKTLNNEIQLKLNEIINS